MEPLGDCRAHEGLDQLGLEEHLVVVEPEHAVATQAQPCIRFDVPTALRRAAVKGDPSSWTASRSPISASSGCPSTHTCCATRTPIACISTTKWLSSPESDSTPATSAIRDARALRHSMRDRTSGAISRLLSADSQIASAVAGS